MNILIVISSIVLLSFIGRQQEKVINKGFKIHIEHPNSDHFIVETDVEAILKNMGYNNAILEIGCVDIKKIETVLNNIGAVKRSEVHYTLDGVITIDIEQREPIARVINQNGSSFYIDYDGNLMPLSNKFTSRVMVINGIVNYSYSQLNEYNINNLDVIEGLEDTNIDQLKSLYHLAKYIYDNAFWKSQIVQSYINANGDFELIPRVGNHTINFGNGNRVKNKFQKLAIFYEKGLSKAGWNEYETINLKYKNQVVCTKR